MGTPVADGYTSVSTYVLQLLVWVGLAFLATACSGNNNARSAHISDDGSAAAASELAVRAVVNATPDMGITGMIERVDGCVYLQSGTTRYVPVFPAGLAEWDGKVLVFDGQTVTAGGEITLAGSEGVYSAEGDVQLPAACDATAPLFLAGQG